MDVLVEVSSVSKRFGRVAAVDRASLSIAPGELVAVLGPSGCG
ncbi:MAG: spermidine/putrescine ABC transporter ATP-binding protein, partial [Chloroflexota bacterium]